MWNVDTDLITPQGEAWLERFKETRRPESCSCDISFRYPKTNFGEFGSGYNIEWKQHRCDSISIGEIRKLTSDDDGNYSLRC